MIVRNTTPEEKRRTDELFAIAFEMPMQTGPAEAESDRIHHWAAFADDNREMMSTFTVSDYNIRFDGHSCKMGGIGGVATLPQYRRRGGIRACFEAALPDMYEKGYDFSYLYPFSTGYYRKFGYECCVRKLQLTVLLGLLNPPRTQGEFRLAEKGNPMADSIAAIDAVWESKYNMMVIHTDEDYGWTAKADPAAAQEFTYVYFAPDNAPKAYTTFKMQNQPDGRNLICSRFVFVDKEGYEGLMNLFKSLSADHMFVKFSLPAEPAMQYLMPEWSLGAAQWSVQPAGMVRVVNAAQVLKKAKYLGSGSIVITILDKQIPQNCGTFRVTFENGRATDVQCVSSAPDIIASIPAFSALISGVCGFDEARQWMSGFEIKNPDACFDRVFYRKALMIADYF